MLFGLLLFALEMKVTSYGLLTVGGIVSLIFGSLMLIDSPAPELQLSLGLVLSVVLGFTAIAAFLVRLALAAQRAAPVTGAEGLIGETGHVLDADCARRARPRARARRDLERRCGRADRAAAIA